MAVGLFFVLAVLRGLSPAVDLTTVIFTVLAFGWLILPIFAFGLDGTLDPATLALYPLRKPQRIYLLVRTTVNPIHLPVFGFLTEYATQQD